MFCWCFNWRMVILASKQSDITRFLDAVSMGATGTMQELLDMKLVDINDKDDLGRNALFYVYNDNKTQNFLLDKGININEFADKKTSNPLMEAISEGRRTLFAKLTNRKVDLDAVDIEGKQALAWAVIYREEFMLDALISLDMDVNHQEDDKKTAVFYAIENDWDIGLRALIKAGAKLNLKDENGIDAFRYADECKAVNCNKLLKPLSFKAEYKTFLIHKQAIKSSKIAKISPPKGAS